MFVLEPDDDSLATLERATIPSGAPDTCYRLDRVLGSGGMSVAFFALRAAANGTTPVVLKFIRPNMVRYAESTAALIVEKEAIALRRLADRVPPTPFVVRLLESGAVSVEQQGARLELPWLAVEYVHGGAEGTTLHERVLHCVEHTGFAFDAMRAGHALACLASGIDVIHEVAVIHRDIKPDNILCCGFGEDEIFKVADFGLARPKGFKATFGGIPVGTPGYSAPEQIVLDDARIGVASDIFSLGAVVFRMLTGEDLFPARHEVEALELIQTRARRSVTESECLSPELRERSSACRAIDAAIARATSVDVAQRPESGAVLAATLRPVLQAESTRLRPSRRRLQSVALSGIPTMLSGWEWTVRRTPGEDRIVRSVAWDADGRCLAATNRGLMFWNGSSWDFARPNGLPDGTGIRFVQRVSAGTWMVGGDGGIFAHYSADGVSNVVQAEDPRLSFSHASGDVADLAVLVGAVPDSPPTFYALAARHWLKPATLRKATNVASVARMEEERWLVAGRSASGDGFVALYSPLAWEVKRIAAPKARAYLDCAARMDVGVGMVAGADGHVLRLTGGGVHESLVPELPDVSAVAVDLGGCAWAGTLGSLWLQLPDSPDRWRRVWHEPSWVVPFVSVHADQGLVVAMSADGGIVEGRSKKS